MSLPRPDENSVVVVTGASAGTGRELARQLGARGHALVIVARRKGRLEEVAAELRDRHDVRVDVHPCDLADQDARDGLIAALRSDGRFVAALCNDAGQGTYGRLQELPFEQEIEQVRVNVDALFELTGAVLPEMVSRGTGAILNVGSLAGFQPLPRNVTYGATKAFVNSFSQGLNADLAGSGVSCTVLCPGPVASEFFDAAEVPSWTRAGPKFLWASPAEMAKACIGAMEKGKRMVYPRFTWGVTALGGRILPRQVLLPATGRVLDMWVKAAQRGRADPPA